MNAWKNGAIIAIFVLVLISSGCISLLEPSYKIRCSTGEKVSDPSLCPEVTTATTTPSTTTSAPITTAPPTTPPITTPNPTISASPITTPPPTLPPTATTFPPIGAPISPDLRYDELKVLNTYTFKRYNKYSVIGEIENIGDENAMLYNVNSTFYDNQGQVLGQTDYDVLGLRYIRPGQKVPFMADSHLSIDANVSSIQTQVVGQIERYKRYKPYDNYEIISHQGSIDELGQYVVTGEVKNIGDIEKFETWVLASFYDSEGKLIWMESDVVFHVSLGMTSPFKIGPIFNEEISSKIENYKFIVEGYELGGR